MDHEYDVLGGYIPSFIQHLEDTGVRLGLRIGSQVNKDRSGASDAAEELAGASALWTPAEHDAFFRALSVHSRWRPDLIAACVPTKTEWEVWMYLEALEEGAATLARQQSVDAEHDFEDERRVVDMQVNRSSPSSCSHSGSDVDDGEYLCRPAFEVSQAWIDVEERMASWIVCEEHLTPVEGDAAADMEDMDDEPAKQGRGRSRGAGRGRSQSRVQGQMVSNEGCHSLPPDYYSPSPEHTSTSTLAYRREALMGRLEAPHLLVLDGILREGEEAMAEKSQGCGDSIPKHGDQRVPRVRDVQVLGSSHRRTALEGTINTSESSSNVMIDPVLLAVSGGAEPAGHQPGDSTSTRCAPAHVPTHGVSSLPSCPSQPGMGNVLVFPLENAAVDNAGSTDSVESDLSLFSPRSRRRIQKRLYMRRKRALREDGSQGTVYTGSERLKPGKKAKLPQSETVSASVPSCEAPFDVDMQPSDNASKKGKPGLTLSLKLKAQFNELGINAAYLRGQGMDLLHLNALGKLMGLCTSLEEADGSGIAQSIDAQLVRHLQAAMIRFVTDVIHRAIVWKEREQRLKQRSRAWRHGDQITVSAVEHAVEAIGARYHSHKEYFESLGALCGLSSDPSLGPADVSEAPKPSDASVEPDVEAAGRSAKILGLAPHRDVYTPLVHPPSAWGMGPLGSLTRTYEREAGRTRRGTSAETEEELMSDETDEEALAAELEDEDEADARDMELAAADEEALWIR